MSDTTDDTDSWERRLREESETPPVQAEMRAFLAEHPPQTELEALREDTRGGADLARLVDEGREHRK